VLGDGERVDGVWWVDELGERYAYGDLDVEEAYAIDSEGNRYAGEVAGSTRPRGLAVCVDV
jgi:hypothetical protein